MGNIANTITSPLGVKLFKGGPYADAGAGDKMQGNLDAYMQQIGPLIASIASNAGIANPMVPGSQPASTDPYGLSPLDLASLNQTESATSQGYDKIMKSAKANLSARGLYDSSMEPAMQEYLQSQLQTTLGQEKIQAGQNAYQNRVQAQQQIAQLLGQAFGARQQVTQQQGQTAVAARNDSMGNLGSLIGMFLGGGFGRGGSPAPTIPGTVPIAGGVQYPAMYGTSIPGNPTGNTAATFANWPSIFGG